MTTTTTPQVTTWVVPLVHKLSGNRRAMTIEARNPCHAIESAQELNPGWSAQFPVRKKEEWQ